MKKLALIFALLSLVTVLLSGCGSSTQNNQGTKDNTGSPTAAPTEAPKATATPVPIDYNKIKPDESGKIMVVMFHNFVQTFKPTRYDDGEYTTTFADFR